MKGWVLWALQNDIKVLIGTASFDSALPSELDMTALKEKKHLIIAISPVNEGSKKGPTFDFLKDIPRIEVFIHSDAWSYDPITDNILAVNIYGLYGNMCCCDNVCNTDASEDVDTLNLQLPWTGDPRPIMKGEFDDIFKEHPNTKLWVTETGWSSESSAPLRRNIAWSNKKNLTRNYKEFLKYDNTKNNTPEYIFYFSLSDANGESFGLYNQNFTLKVV
jgi:hypothetical protein